MEPKPLVLRGATLAPYFQLYKYVDNYEADSGELLTRLESGASAYDLISQLNIEEHFELLIWLIENSNYLATKWQITCSVNVDSSLLLAESDRACFLEISKSAATRTTFEFTETKAMPSSIEANKLFNTLREQGQSSALDDFGAGLNGMTMLTDYDFDIVKVDRALTMDLDLRPEKLKVLSLLLEMLTALNKSHVVEVNDTEAVFELMKTAGYRVFQSYQFYRPILFSELNRLQRIKVQQ